MRVRALDLTPDPVSGQPAYDMQFGRGQANFLRDVPAAPAQCALTRLMLYTGDWFLNIAEGTGWRTRVLGKRTNATRDPEMRARILGTQGVTGIASYASQIDRATRGYAIQAVIDTAFGQALVATPTNAANVDVRLGR